MLYNIRKQQKTILRFEKGISGNPNGRPPGAMGKRNMELAELLRNNAHLLIQTAIDKAIEGDTTVLNKLLDKIVPTLNKNDNENKNYNVDFAKKINELKELREQNNLELIQKQDFKQTG